MQIFEDAAISQGWTPQTQVVVLLRYIGNQQSHEAFEDFLAGQISEEEDAGAINAALLAAAMLATTRRRR